MPTIVGDSVKKVVGTSEELRLRQQIEQLWEDNRILCERLVKAGDIVAYPVTTRRKSIVSSRDLATRPTSPLDSTRTRLRGSTTLTSIPNSTIIADNLYQGTGARPKSAGKAKIGNKQLKEDILFD